MDFRVTAEVMSVVPVADILNSWGSGDANYYNMSLPELLDRKRKDAHYPMLVETLKTEGWTKGIKCVNYFGDVPWMTDGHHRLAAAIDLGQKYVPVETGYCENDSGSWGRTANTRRGWV